MTYFVLYIYIYLLYNICIRRVIGIIIIIMCPTYYYYPSDGGGINNGYASVGPRTTQSASRPTRGPSLSRHVWSVSHLPTYLYAARIQSYYYYLYITGYVVVVFMMVVMAGWDGSPTRACARSIYTNL